MAKVRSNKAKRSIKIKEKSIALIHILLLFLLSITIGCATAHKSHLKLASELVLKGKQELAIEEYRKAIEEDSTDVQAIFELAHIYCDREEWDEAIPLLEITIQLEPNFRTTNILIARAYFGAGRIQDAELKVFPAEIDTTEVNLLYTIGREFHGKGLFQKACKYFERIVVKDERIYEPYPHLAQIYCSEQRYIEAINLLNKFLNERPNRYEHMYLAMIYSKVDSTDKAKEEFHKIIALSDTFYYGHPRRPNHYWKGHALYMWGNYEEAEKEWKIYKQSHLNNVVAYHNLCVIYLITGICDNWEKEYKEAKELFPEEPFLYIEESFKYLEEGNYSDALLKLRNVKGACQFSGVCNGLMAYTLEKLGRHEEAKQYWNLCILRVPGGVNFQKVQEFIEKMVNNAVECIRTK